MKERIVPWVLLILALPLLFGAAAASPALASGTTNLGLYTTSVRLSLSPVSPGAGTVMVLGNVVVLAQGRSPAAGAAVRAIWALPGGSPLGANAVTDKDGVAKFAVNGPAGTYIVTVADIVKSGYLFMPLMSVLSAGFSTDPLKGDLLRSSAIKMSFAQVSAGTASSNVYAAVTVVDSTETLIAGAKVNAFWVLPGGRLVLASAITDAAGVAKFAVTGPIGNFIFTVSNISAKSLSFDAADSALSKAISTAGGTITGQ